jgi:hypothetical protein
MTGSPSTGAVVGVRYPLRTPRAGAGAATTQDPMPTRTQSVLAAALALLSACAAPSASWNEGAGTPATPMRPTYAHSTFTTAPGTLEVETGVTYDPSDATSVPTTLKYGVNDRIDVFADFAPASAVENGGVGAGDVYLGYRQRLTEQQLGHLSLAWQALAKLPTADEDKGLGTGEFDALVAGIGTLPMEDWSATGFAELGLLGDPGGSGTDLHLALSAMADRRLSRGGGIFGELAGVFVDDRNYDAVFTTLGAAWSPSPGLVLDAGVVLGLSDDAPDARAQELVRATLRPRWPRRSDAGAPWCASPGSSWSAARSPSSSVGRSTWRARARSTRPTRPRSNAPAGRSCTCRACPTTPTRPSSRTRPWCCRRSPCCRAWATTAAAARARACARRWRACARCWS